MVRELSLGLGTAFLKVWNSLPSGFNSEVSIKFEIKNHLSECFVFFLFVFAVVVLDGTFRVVIFSSLNIS